MVPELSKNEIKHINALKSKKYRYAFLEFLAEGPKVVSEFLQEGWLPRLLVVEQGNDLNFPELDKNVLRSCSKSAFDKISALQTPNSVLAIFAMPTDRKQVSELSGWTIVLDDIRDPGNLGTIIRIADWFGISQILCSPGCADPYNPKTVQATMGSLARVKVMEGDLHEVLERNDRLPLYAAVMDGIPYQQVDFPEEGILLIGNESKGISSDLLADVNHLVTIPRIGKAESLNAAIATAILCSGIRSSLY